MRIHIIIFLIILTISCNSNTEKETVNADILSQNIVVDNLTSFDYLRIVKSFSENYKPDSIPNKGIGHLNSIPDSVIKAFQALRDVNKKEQEIFLTLIILKLYRGHLQCCNQSYEIRKKPSRFIDSISDPLLFEFNLITKQFNEPIDFISSDIAFQWVSKNKNLLENKNISIEFNKIKNTGNMR